VRYAEKAAAHGRHLAGCERKSARDDPPSGIGCGIALVDNAVKFTIGKTGCVHVSVSQQDGGFWIAVSDEGIGISEHDVLRVFQSFHQVDRETHEQQGAGVGLAIVKGIVDLHGGRIDVKSRVGEGSTFGIWLPVLEE
jgi:signal transduction histidine kinase